MKNNLTKIASYSFPHQAHIAKASLDAANIPCFIANEYTINMQWLYSNAMGGVSLSVPSAFKEEAIEIINRDYSDAVEKEFEVLEEEEKNSCPDCGSEQLEPYTIGKKSAFIVFLLLGFPLFFYKHGYKCNKCEHIFTT